MSGLPSNYVINRLLSRRSKSTPSCEKHEGEILKLFCQSCDQLICRDCIIFDHCYHKYSFVKDIFPAEKKKILKVVEESKVNIRDLQGYIKTLKEQEEVININSMQVNFEVENFIERQIKLLEQRREIIKEELRKSVLTQKKTIDSRMKAVDTSLACATSSVEFIEQTLSKGSEVDVLSAKNEMIQQLTEINSTAMNLKPRGKVSYALETHPPLDEKTVGEIVKIIKYDEEYRLTIFKRVPPSGVAQAVKRIFKLPESMFSRDELCESIVSTAERVSTFYILPKSKHTKLIPGNEVQVKIKSPDSDQVHLPTIECHQDGSFCFRHHPQSKAGNYKIEIIINGRYMQGSPFTWEVYSPVLHS